MLRGNGCVWTVAGATAATATGLATLLALTTPGAPAAALATTNVTLQLPAGHRSTEANVAVDRTDPNDVLVVARDENGGPRVGLRYWRSRAGGRTFRGGLLVNGRLGALTADGSDPVALYDALGRPGPAFLTLRYARTSWESRIMLGGRIVVRVKHGPPIPTLGEVFGRPVWYDKPWAVIDPKTGVGYVTLTERSETRTGPVEKIAVARAGPGRAFPRPRVLSDGNGSQPVIGPGGTVIVVFYQQHNLSPQARILSSRSRDGGRTWSHPTVIASRVNARGDPPFPTVVRSGAGYVTCWQQYATWPRERVAWAHSSDGAS